MVGRVFDGLWYNMTAMNEQQDKTKGERRDDVRRKRRFAPRLHGKRLAELVHNALRKRLGRKE